MVPKYWTGVSLRCVPPPHSQDRITIQKSARQPDPVTSGTTEGPTEQGLYHLQADSPKEDKDRKGATASPLLPA